MSGPPTPDVFGAYSGHLWHGGKRVGARKAPVLSTGPGTYAVETQRTDAKSGSGSKV